MAYVFHIKTFAPCDPVALQEAYVARLHEDRRLLNAQPNGAAICGIGRGIQVHAEVVQANPKAAEIWLRRRYNDPTAPAGAIRFIPSTQRLLHPSPRLLACEQRITTLTQRLRELPAGMVARARAVKSRTRTCHDCGSAVAVERIGTQSEHLGRLSVECPVCGSARFLETAGDVARRDRLQARLRSAEAARDLEAAALEAALLRAVPLERCCWMVGVSCPHIRVNLKPPA